MDDAVRAWLLMSGRKTKPLLVDPRFTEDAPPPFAWSILSGSAGVAEVREGGGLDLVYYGREPSEFARQMLGLAPGRYRIASLATRADGGTALQWRVGCPDGAPAVIVPLGKTAEFDVKPGCSSQMLVLVGTPSEPAQTIDTTITSVTIQRVAP